DFARQPGWRRAFAAGGGGVVDAPKSRVSNFAGDASTWRCDPGPDGVIFPRPSDGAQRGKLASFNQNFGRPNFYVAAAWEHDAAPHDMEALPQLRVRESNGRIRNRIGHF